MTNRSQNTTKTNGVAGWTDYATPEDFDSLFESKRDSLFRLALLLTGSAEKALQSLSLALRDCKLNGSVSTGWTLPWARRAIVRNAIQLISRPPSDQHRLASKDDSSEGRRQAIRVGTLLRIDISSIENLPDFERLVLVITVLEHISIQDCALLLAQLPKQVREAQERAMLMASVVKHDFKRSVEGAAGTSDSLCGKLLEN